MGKLQTCQPEHTPGTLDKKSFLFVLSLQTIEGNFSVPISVVAVFFHDSLVYVSRQVYSMNGRYGTPCMVYLHAAALANLVHGGSPQTNDVTGNESLITGMKMFVDLLNIPVRIYLLLSSCQLKLFLSF